MLTRLVAAAALTACAAPVLAAPTVDVTQHESRDIVKRTVPAAPRFVIYSDEWVSGENGPPAVSEIEVRGFWAQRVCTMCLTLLLQGLQRLVCHGHCGRSAVRV